MTGTTSEKDKTSRADVGESESWRRLYGESLTPTSVSGLTPSESRLSARDAFRTAGRNRVLVFENDETTLPGTPFGSPIGTPISGDSPSTNWRALLRLDTQTELAVRGPRPRRQDGEVEDSQSLVFLDGVRRIDYVLVYEDPEELLDITEDRRREKRAVFQENLLAKGLQLELEDRERAFDKKTYFLKIYVPWKVMRRYAGIMNLKMPAKRFITVSSNAWNGSTSRMNSFEPPDLQSKPTKNEHNKLQEPSFYASAVGRPKEEKFVVKDRESEYTPAQRSQVVWQIMMRCRYDENDKDKVGVRRLLNNQTYLAAFPLHEGRYKGEFKEGTALDRRTLYMDWARPRNWYKKQPLWLVRKYFGDKIGLYFAWLGFYTEMLIPASIVGLLCFIYGIASMNSQDNIPSKEICDPHGAGNVTLCPLCDKACDYQKLKHSCLFAKLTYLFDNPATVFFAIFMSFWATSFLELWKRRQAVIAWEWDLQHVEVDQEPRPEFEASVKTFRVNPVTGRREPYLPTWSRALRLFATGSMVLFMLCVVICAVVGTIIYRLSIVSVMHSSSDIFIKKHAKIVTSITAAMINLVIIMMLTKFYNRLALWLTNLENPRTQIEYEDSFTFKIFLFEFMNFYSSLIYIAFFKGRFFVHPGDQDVRRSEILKLKGDVCDPAGCLSELCIHLAIIMIGKQFFNNFMELLLPKLENWYRKRTHRSQTKDPERIYNRWEEDYQLQDGGRLALFQEYLEMVLQYGFVTLFVAAFPLAPLFALINNVAEIRLDAYKMLTQARRPLAERVQDIGAWYGILQGVTYTAVVSNAFVIAYTSDFIPRMVYKIAYSKKHSLEGYIESSLSVFNTSDYREGMGVDSRDTSGPIPPTCSYRGYRNSPGNGSQEYDLSSQYWHVFAARLAFVVVFEHIVFALTGIMAYAIPDVPSEVRTQIQRERLLAKEAKFDHVLKRELNRSASEGTTPSPLPLSLPGGTRSSSPVVRTLPSSRQNGDQRHRRPVIPASMWEVS